MQYEQISILLFILVFIEFASSWNSILQFRELRNFWKFMSPMFLALSIEKFVNEIFILSKEKNNVKFFALNYLHR